jgi:hypothetical protein
MSPCGPPIFSFKINVGIHMSHRGHSWKVYLWGRNVACMHPITGFAHPLSLFLTMIYRLAVAPVARVAPGLFFQ